MGRRGGGQTPEQARTEKRKEEEFQKLQSIEAQKTRAAGRRTRGRASLISGSEAGIGNGDFAALNLGTKTRLGAEAERKRIEAERLKKSKIKPQRQAEGVLSHMVSDA